MQTNRLYFIDAVRAFAILMMLQGHFIYTLIDPVYKDSAYTAYTIWSYFRGITAPTFFTISGLVFAYLLQKAYAKGDDKPRIKKGLLRGLLLLGIGYSLRINMLSWLNGQFNTYFLVVDVLQCIGISLILLVTLHVLLKKYSYLFSIVLFIIGFMCFITEPLYRNLEITNLPLILANYMTTTNGSVFTILPWFGYSAFGAFISTIFFRRVHRERFKIWTIILFFTIGLLLLFCSTQVLAKIYHVTAIDLFKLSAGYNYLFTRLGDVLIIFAIFYTFEFALKKAIIVKIGQKTLSIYVIHFIILYGSFTGYGLKRFFYKSLHPTETILGAILFMIVVSFIAFHYARTNAFIYKLAVKLIDKFKKVKNGV